MGFNHNHEKLLKSTYSQGFRDGVKAAEKADLKIKLVQALKNTKGVGDKTIKKVLQTLKTLEVEE